MSRLIPAGAALAVAVVLAACGQEPTERGMGGAGVGAATGAAVGAVTPLTPIGGAIIGGAAGAVAGSVTEPEDVDLGTPIWKR